MARPNRPRIAGQRRTPDRRPEDTGTPSEVVAEASDVAAEAPETALPEVTQATPEVPESVSEPLQDEKPVTQSAEIEEPEAAAAPTEAPADRSRRLGVVLSATLGVLLVLILAFAGILGVKAWKGKEAEDARDQAANAGRKAAEIALSYDYRTLDKSFGAARATMTPEFAAKFDETAKVAGELATKTKATVRADVREVGVRDGDADRVTLIIFVNQITTSTITQGKPRVDLNRTRFTMVRNGDQWLVQEIAGL
jgi:Mce-associated membrane protein